MSSHDTKNLAKRRFLENTRDQCQARFHNCMLWAWTMTGATAWAGFEAVVEHHDKAPMAAMYFGASALLLGYMGDQSRTVAKIMEDHLRNGPQ